MFMRNNDIDDLIKRKNFSVILSNNIDCSNMNMENILLDIYAEVNFNMSKISESDDYGIIVFPEYDTKRLGLLKKLDLYAKKFSYYYKIRPYLKNKFSFLKKVRYINVNDILDNNLDDENYIIYLYNTILNREPIDTDILNCKAFLNKKGVKRIDLIIFLSKSEEAERSNIVVKGLKLRKFLRKLNRSIYKIIEFTNKI